MEVSLNEEQYKIFQLLAKGKKVPLAEIEEKTGLEQSKIMAFAVESKEAGWLEIHEESRDEFLLREDGPETLPERVLLLHLKSEKALPMAELSKVLGDLGLEMKDIMKWGIQRGWFERQGGNFVLPGKSLKYLEEKDDDEKVLEYLKSAKKAFIGDLVKNLKVKEERTYLLLKRRQELVKIKERKIRALELTKAVKAKEVRERSQLTPEEIESGNWQESLKELKPYDITLPAKIRFPAKIHPLQKIFQETRQAFLKMGFEEIASPYVETAFWDFDALFQPQDHPARDMQDTFYMKTPGKGKLPDSRLVKKIQATHEDGGDTGSTGWGYQWKEEEARRLVLRTHTTATTVRALAKNPNPPRKVFCVGRVFRNETISYKHLPEFHQVDGIVIDKDASLATLLGTLREFYLNMGFVEVKFKPAFFPYTEPSAEVFVWMEGKGWIELGGSGIFRPEVTEPLGCKVPVLAWGLGLERLAMIRYGLKDIRNLYWSDVSWLEEVPLCQ